jgi:hypothetical protein
MNSRTSKLLLTGIIIISLFCILLMNSSSTSECSASTGAGYWRLIEVQEVGIMNTFGGIVVGHSKHENISTFHRETISGQRGRVEGRHQVFIRQSSNMVLSQNMAGYVTWNEPPKQAKPGDIWDGQFEYKITEDYALGRKEHPVYFGIFISHSMLDNKINREFQGSPNEKVGLAMTTAQKVPDFNLFFHHRAKLWNNLNQSKFEFPPYQPSSSGNFLCIQVQALVVQNHRHDTYNYWYEWVSPDPKEITGNLVLTAKHNYIGNVGNLKVKITNLEDNTKIEALTDEHGQIKRQLKATTTNDYIRLRIDSYEITHETYYTIPGEGKNPSFVNEVRPAENKINREIQVYNIDQHRFTHIEQEVPLSRVTLFPVKWDDEQLKWVPCRVAVAGRTPKTFRQFMIRANDFQEAEDGSISRVVYFPGAAVLKTRSIKLEAIKTSEQLKDIQEFDITPAKASPTNTITFLMSDASMMLARLRAKMVKYFSPVFGEDRAKQLASPRIVPNSSYDSPCYKDGVIYLPGNLDLTQDTTCDTLMHEWSHYIMDVLANDPGVESMVGGTHDTWTKASNKETAWDEGRAHFLGLIMSRALELPSKMDVFYQPDIDRSARNIQDAGDTVEGVITQALTNYYVKTGYTRTREVMRDFQAVQNLGVQQLGYPPRTSPEFFAMKKLYLETQRDNGQIDAATAAARLNELNNIVTTFRITH